MYFLFWRKLIMNKLLLFSPEKKISPLQVWINAWSYELIKIEKEELHENFASLDIFLKWLDEQHTEIYNEYKNYTLWINLSERNKTWALADVDKNTTLEEVFAIVANLLDTSWTENKSNTLITSFLYWILDNLSKENTNSENKSLEKIWLQIAIPNLINKVQTNQEKNTTSSQTTVEKTEIQKPNTNNKIIEEVEKVEQTKFDIFLEKLSEKERETYETYKNYTIWNNIPNIIWARIIYWVGKTNTLKFDLQNVNENTTLEQFLRILINEGKNHVVKSIENTIWEIKQHLESEWNRLIKDQFRSEYTIAVWKGKLEKSSSRTEYINWIQNGWIQKEFEKLSMSLIEDIWKRKNSSTFQNSLKNRMIALTTSQFLSELSGKYAAEIYKKLEK